MTNITEEVRRILANDVAIENCLALGVINMRGLAKFLIKKHQLDASVDSVISAIRRFDAKQEYKYHKQKLRELFEHSSLHTKTNIIAIGIVGRQNISRCINRISTIVDLDKGDTLRMVKGDAFLKVIVDEPKLAPLRDLLACDSMEVTKDLVEISIRTNAGNLNKTKGVMARISNELAMNNINIEEFVFSASNIHVYVNKKYYVRAHSALLALADK